MSAPTTQQPTNLQEIQLIQGGMGVYVSNWRLARAVAAERPGATVGTVSGTALDVVYVRLLQLGDPGGHARRALVALDTQCHTSIGSRICERYYIPGGKAPEARFRSSPMQLVHAADGSLLRKVPEGAGPVHLSLSEEAVELLIATGFAEVWLAKEGHSGNIFINFLNKIELPLIYTMYGAMLAGVNGIIVGAGNPDGLPAVCTSLASHRAITHPVSVLYRSAGEEFLLAFDPQKVDGGRLTAAPIQRPPFLAIVSLEDLVQALVQSESQAPDGFIIENYRAGGHNANPVGPLRRDEQGQPIYGPKDEPDLAAIKAAGKPFWLAGGYGSFDRLREAQALGAYGVQAGSVFALAEESGMKPDYRSAILNELKKGTDDADLVHTTIFSPTGFAFKVVQIPNTLSQQDVYEERRRVCDIGMLQQIGLSSSGENGTRDLFQRCPAGPVDTYVGRRGLERNTEERRCLCNGLLACVGLGQVKEQGGELYEEPAIVTLGDHLDGVRRLSREGQAHYWAGDVVRDILGSQHVTAGA